ncbi:hypothetical protein GCM10010172_35150 [Paractinoplanes ferrugineus]|uniref:DUF4031 domain-containing protein n=1 Tax=Paractinoplanes ferrugineus TaxID=113564 RepID=A0A919JAL0_9ACTN|nr:DUF4031 domain-containing protein [Actinoplanes ferrugineus]GIE16775.1 hypothetical protein Afe05nite_86150 [Actinoplanes ferrugineus]
MTVYVDNFRAPATVGRIRGRWSHLTADSPDELHAFAARLGHRRDWFQARCKYARCPTVDGVCAHFHYDVVDRNRTAAIALGAVPIDLREMGALVSARRPQFRKDSPMADNQPTPTPVNEIDDSLSDGDDIVYAPCQPIGCDAGRHLPGCVYAEADE